MTAAEEINVREAFIKGLIDRYCLEGREDEAKKILWSIIEYLKSLRNRRVLVVKEEEIWDNL